MGELDFRVYRIDPEEIKRNPKEYTKRALKARPPYKLPKCLKAWQHSNPKTLCRVVADDTGKPFSDNSYYRRFAYKKEKNMKLK